MQPLSLLEKTLLVAVPLWVENLNKEPIDNLLPRTQGYASFIGQYGDALLYGTSQKGLAAECFNKVAEGLAILAMVCPGGVKFGNIHFEFPHKDLRSNK